MVNYIEPVPKEYKIINLNQHLGTWTKVRIEFKYFLKIHTCTYGSSTSVWASVTGTPLILYRFT